MCDRGGQTCSMYEPHIVIAMLQRGRNIKIVKHDFVSNLRFCDIIYLFGTTCKTNTVRHASSHCTILQYLYHLQYKQKMKDKHIIFRKSQRAAWKGSKRRSLATPDI